MIDIQIALRQRYPEIHPLLFFRCIEKTTTNVELFDMLETLPKTYPIIWDHDIKQWATTDLLQNDSSKEKE